VAAIKEFYQISKELYADIDKPVESKDRDHVIAKIQSFLSKREALLSDIKSPLTPEEKQIGQEALELNERIQAKMQAIKLEIQRDIVTVKNQKKNAPKYINPYQSLQRGGILYDKRN
jgi:flagellar protein FliT